MEPKWGPRGSCRPQMGPMLAQWTLLSGIVISLYRSSCRLVFFWNFICIHLPCVWAYSLWYDYQYVASNIRRYIHLPSHQHLYPYITCSIDFVFAQSMLLMKGVVGSGRRWFLNTLWPSDSMWRTSWSTGYRVLPDGTKPVTEPVLT